MVRLAHLDVDDLRALLGPVVRGVGVVVVAEDLPHGRGPGGLGHPQQAARRPGPQLLVHALEDRPVSLVVHQLGLALEVLEAGGRAQLGGHGVEEGLGRAVPGGMPVVIGPDVADRPAVGSGHGGLERLQGRERRRADLDRETLGVLGEIGLRLAVVIGPAVLQVHPVGAAGVPARAVQVVDQRLQPLVEDRLRHALVAAEPQGDRGVVAIAADDVRGVVQEQRHVLRLQLVVLGRGPEVVQHQQAVLVGQVVEDVLGVLPHPVADGVEVGVLVQAEIGLQPLARHPLAPVVRTPVAAARGDLHAVDLDDQVGRQAGVGHVLHGGRSLPNLGQRGGPAVGDLADALVAAVGDVLAQLAGLGVVDLDPTQLAVAVHQRQLVGHLAQADAAVLLVGRPCRRPRRSGAGRTGSGRRSRWATTAWGSGPTAAEVGGLEHHLDPWPGARMTVVSTATVSKAARTVA
jgi:hypothetical protein